MGATILISLKILLLVSFVFKSYFHYYIASKNNIFLGGGAGLPYRTLWYISKPVDTEYESLKKWCNRLQTANLILFVIVITLSYLI